MEMQADMPAASSLTITQPPAELLDALRAGKDILCLSHIGPDGDCVGSLLGMAWILRALGKSPTLALQDPVPYEHRVLPGADDILTAAHRDYSTRVRKHAFDLIVVLDSSTPDRMGTVYNEKVHAQAKLVVIDHHITNTGFGAVNWVAPECAATCQMLVYLAAALEVPLQGALAECLLTGLITDTLGFRTNSTTPTVMEAARQLMAGGANLGEITQRTVNRRSLSQLKVWAQALPDFKLEERVIWTTVSRAQLKAAGHHNGEIDLSGFLITVDDADMSVVFTEKLDEKGVTQIDCSFRAKPGFDVSQVALDLGGGGHPPASGAKIAGTLEEVCARVIDALKAAHRAQSAAPHAE